MHQPSNASRQDALTALRYRDFRLFFMGRVLLFMGFQMQSVAIGWELYDRTGSALVLGTVGLMQFLPILLLTLFSGHLADRRDRKSIVLTMNLLLALCSLGLASLSFVKGPIPLFYGCLLVTGIARAFNKPAGDALMWQLIPTSAYTNAATWSSTSFQLASVLGPALGGLVIALQGKATGVYVLAAIASLLCFIFIALVKPSQTVYSKSPLSLAALFAGVRFVWQNQVVLAAITLDLFAVLLGGATALLPIFAKDILHVGPAQLGWMQAAPAIGALLMAVVLAHLSPFRRAGRMLLGSVFGFGLVTIIFGLSRWLWLSLLMLVLLGALDNISVVIRQTLVQIRTPDHLRGRVSAINSIFITTSNELGSFESGIAAALFGPVIAVVGGGIGTIAVVIISACIFPEIRKLGKLHEPPTESELTASSSVSS